MIRNNCGFDFSAEGDRLTVSVGGEIDHHGAAPLRDGIDALIWEYRPKHLYLDMSGVEFMDSSGIAVVVQTARKCAACGSRFALCRVPAQAKKVLCAAGIDRLVRIWEEERP